MEEIRDSFSRAAEKSEEPSGIDFLEAILRERPDLGNQTAYFPEQGALGHVVFIGNEVFKGPKFAFMAPVIDAECENLKKLGGKGLPIPEVTCVGKETVFYGMTRIPGTKLGVDFADTLTSAQQRNLAKDVVNYIIGLAKTLSVQDGKFAVNFDVNGENILADPQTKKMTGIVDCATILYCTKEELPSYSPFKSEDFQKMVEEEFALRAGELPGTIKKPAAKPARKHPRK